MPHRLSSIFGILALTAACWSFLSGAASATSCGCAAQQQAAMFGPGRTKRSALGSDALPGGSDEIISDEDAIRIGDTLIPRREFERAASPGGGGRLSSSPSDYINCVRPWPNGVLKYRFSTSFPDAYKSLIRDSLATLQSRTGNLVTFSEAESYFLQAHVTIINGSGCWSYVGKIYSYSSQNLSLAVPGCMLDSIIQNMFIFALGFNHEHSRSDRDSHVNIAWNSIRNDSCSNFYKNSYQIPSDFPSYDYASILHFTSYSFACNSSVPVITKTTGGTIDSRNNLTNTDVAKLRYVYSSSNLQYCFGTSSSTSTTARSAGSVLLGSWLSVACCFISAAVLIKN